jgi:UDP-4-amino-4-deoxy-L-arabinose formyltransferase/UDP-glucuronic acid dehydrogenase (UDP-4-keto-hexauronic acid decarboxylating)
MKTIVFAYHDMGITGLAALQRAGFEIAAVFSHADDPEENCWFGSVPAWAKANNVPLFCPEDVNAPEWVAKIAAWAPEAIFSFYYRNMLSAALLAIPQRGAFNLHGSFLPHYRGRCPVNWVLVNGETETGVTLHYMVEKADAGDIVARQAVPIAFDDTARSLYGKLCRQAAVLLDEALPLIQTGTAPRIPQDWRQGSYCGRRTPADGRIDWHWPALTIYNLIRAVTEPYPGAFTFTARGDMITIWWAEPETAGTIPGRAGQVLIENGAVVICAGEGRLRLLDVEMNGRRLKNSGIEGLFKEREGELLS